MIEIRLRAAASNPASRKYSFALSLLTTAVLTVAPVVTSRAQDASPQSLMTAEVDGLHASRSLTLDGGRTVSIDAGDAVSITSGASSITLRKDGTIILKGTEIVIDGAKKIGGKPGEEPSGRRASLMSEIF